MPDISVKLGEETLNLAAGDLFKFAKANAPVAFHLAQNEILQTLNKTLAEITAPTNTLSLGLSVGQDASWDLGSEANLSFGFRAGAEGFLTIQKSGALLSYRLGEDEDEVVTVKVPAQHAYVSLGLKVSLGVNGGAAFSHGGFGVNGNLEKSVEFNLINHKCVPLTMTVKDAIHAAFAHFVLPFKTSGFDQLNHNDFVEYEFIGKLGLGFGASYGLGGSFFAGRSSAELMKSFQSPVGQLLVGVNPTFSAQAAFGVQYNHEDAFRILVGRQKTASVNTLTMFLFKMDQSTLTTSFTATFGVNAGAAFNLKLKINEIIENTAKQLFGNIANAQLRAAAIATFKDSLNKEPHKRELEKHVREVNRKIAKLLSPLNHQKTELQILHERIKTHTALFNFTFDLQEPDALAQGYAKALAGNYFAAIQVKGVALAAGSFVEDVFIRRSSLRFYFFDLFNLTSTTEYIQKTTIVYAGEGVFKLRHLTGVTHEEGHVGHEKHAEVFFTANARTTDFATIDDLEVRLHFVLQEKANRKAARQTVAALQAVGNPALLAHANRLLQILEMDAALTVKVNCVFARSAYGKITSDDYLNNKPPALPHANDRKNWDTFVKAVEDIKEQDFRAEGFPDIAQSFDAYTLYNRTTNGTIGTSRPPDRRNPGNDFSPASVWPAQWSNISHDNRRFISMYLKAGRQFMNLCDDLKHLALDVTEINSDKQYRQLLKELNDMIQQDVAIWFTKTILLSLLRITGGNIVNLVAPTEEPFLDDTFAISFDVA